MKKSKTEKLKAAGWKTGSVQEFLELSPEENSIIEVRVALFEALQKTRKEKKLTQQQAAKVLKTSQSRISKMESGDPSVSFDLMIRSLVALGARKKDFSRIFE
ncbi:MAG: XRE family transcriptional regulator [Deltaproteobacteria bacterium]|jgi:predicted XRE-type DNA-binding protein|nr:XRE family transcriptional regulator [Deltaproteobacteria bacterium]